MKIQSIVVLASTILVSACSFQKDPNKVPPTPVKIGMTKEELRQEVDSSSDITFADKVLFAGKQEDKVLLLQLLDEVDDSNVNDYSKDGVTALDLMIQYKHDAYAVALLQKGASPFKRKRGTNYTIMQLIEEKKEYLPFTSRVIPAATESLYNMGVKLVLHPDALFRFFWKTQFPLTKSVDGKKPILLSILDEREYYRQVVLQGETRNPSMVSLLALLEKVEGNLNDKVDEFLTFFFEAEDLEAFKFFLNKKALSTTQRAELVAKIPDGTLLWLKQMDLLMKFSQEERGAIEKNFIKSLKNRSIKKIRKDLARRSMINFLYEFYPDIYGVAYEKMKDSWPPIVEDISDLPGGKEQTDSDSDFGNKIYQDFINDQNFKSYFPGYH